MLTMSLYDEEAPARLERPPLIDLQKHALFLDLDGTLLEIEERPELVASDRALRELLRDLSEAMNGALAIVSGRSIEDVDRVLHGVAPCVAGLHGQEHRTLETRSTAAPSKAMADALVTVRKLTDGGVLDAMVENKGAGIALHYRRNPEHAEFVRRVADEIAAIHGLRTVHGKMVAELTSSDTSKGQAIFKFLQDSTFAGRRPVAVGDDITDEDAFSAARKLGGFAVHVGDVRSTRASHRLPSVSAVKSWLLASLGRPTL